MKRIFLVTASIALLYLFKTTAIKAQGEFVCYSPIYQCELNEFLSNCEPGFQPSFDCGSCCPPPPDPCEPCPGYNTQFNCIPTAQPTSPVCPSPRPTIPITPTPPPSGCGHAGENCCCTGTIPPYTCECVDGASLPSDPQPDDPNDCICEALPENGECAASWDEDTSSCVVYEDSCNHDYFYPTVGNSEPCTCECLIPYSPYCGDFAQPCCESPPYRQCRYDTLFPMGDPCICQSVEAWDCGEWLEPCCDPPQRCLTNNLQPFEITIGPITLCTCIDNLSVNPEPPPADPDTRMYCTPDGQADNSGIDTALGCIPIENFSETRGFIYTILQLAIGISGGTAFIMVVASMFLLTTSAGDPRKVQAAKELLVATLSGLLLLVLSIFILRTIGVDILEIPGF